MVAADILALGPSWGIDPTVRLGTLIPRSRGDDESPVTWVTNTALERP
jgi:hypothetical protein